jgi:hypothetical protein
VEEACRAVHTSPIPSHQYPLGLKKVTLTPCSSIDDFFCCGFDGGLDSGLTGQFMPYRHSVGERCCDGAKFCSLLSPNQQASRDTPWRRVPSFKPVRRRERFSRCRAKIRVTKVLRLPPEHTVPGQDSRNCAKHFGEARCDTS